MVLTGWAGVAGSSSVVFVPSYATVVEIPLRASRAGTSLRVEVYFDGRPADVVTVRDDVWHTLVLQVPRQGSAKRFRALELRVRESSSSGEEPDLLVGKVRPR